LLVCALGGGIRAQGNQDAPKGFMIESRPAGATVSIEGEIIGKTPCSFPYQLSGRYRLYAEKRGYETVTRDIDFGARKIETITFILTPKTRKWAAGRSLVFTGWGQNYSDQKIKSRLFMALEGAALVSLGIAHERCNHFDAQYRSALENYHLSSATLEQEAAGWKRVKSSYEDWKTMNRWRQAMIYTALGVHALNFLDAILVFPKNLRQIEFLAQPKASQSAPEGSGLTISYTVPF